MARSERTGIPRLVVAICVFLVLVTPTVLSQMDKLLHAMHPPGGSAYGVSSLSPFVGGPDPQTVTGTWAAWKRNAKETARVDPTDLVDEYLVIDGLAFVPFYSALLAILLLSAYHRYEPVPDGAIRRFEIRDPSTAERAARNRHTYRRCILAAFWAVPILFGVDWTENALQAGVAHGWHADLLSPLASFFTYFKWALVALIVFVIATAWIGIGWGRRGTLRTGDSGDRRPAWLRELVLCRANVVIVVALAFLLLAPGPLAGQSLDTMRWMADRYSWIWAPVLLVILFAAVLGVSSRRVLIARQRNPWPLPDTKWFSFWILVASAGLFVVLLVLATKVHVIPIGLVVPPGIAAVVAGLSLFATGATADKAGVLDSPTFVSRAVVAAPFVIFGITAIRAAAGDVFYSGDTRSIVLLLAVGVPFLVAGGVAYAMLAWIDGTSPGFAGNRFSRIGAWVTIVLGVIVAVLFTIGAIEDPWTTASWSDGAVSVTVAALMAAAFIGLLLTLFAEYVPVPPVFALLRLRRLPILTLVVLWFVIASAIDRTGNHQVRAPSDRKAAVPRSYDLEQAFTDWRGTKTELVSVPGSTRKIRPLVFVGAAGGGIKAAYWTDLVLDCLVRPLDCGALGPPIDPHAIFAVSGASGGSLGLVEYATRQQYPADAGKDWVSTKLGADFLGPTFAWMFFVDVPNAFIRTEAWQDRAAILEQSWEKPWPEEQGQDLQEGLYERGNAFPILFLNGTSVNDGCRFETSVVTGAAGLRPNQIVADCRSPAPFDIAGRPGYVSSQDREQWAFAATKDLADYLCPSEDVRLSTAALLSARFPIITPSGKVGCSKPKKVPSYVVDGGYYDNTGASTITELWSHLETLVAAQNRANPNSPCIVPYMIEIDNHYADPAAPSVGTRPNELTVPTTTLNRARDGHDANAILNAAVQFSKGDRFAIVYPRSHPGTEAPLGWTLSDIARTDLEDQLQNEDVSAELQKAREFFEPGNRDCSVAPK